MNTITIAFPNPRLPRILFLLTVIYGLFAYSYGQRPMESFVDFVPQQEVIYAGEAVDFRNVSYGDFDFTWSVRGTETTPMNCSVLKNARDFRVVFPRQGVYLVVLKGVSDGFSDETSMEIEVKGRATSAQAAEEISPLIKP